MKLLLLCVIIIQILTVFCTKEKEIKRRRKAYVALHNELRSKLAHGKSKDNTGSKMPKGQNIYKMVANTSLETTAQEWANGCLYEHSPKEQRNNAGQNIFQRCSTNSSQLEDLNNELTRGILKWWGELEEFGYNKDLLIQGNDNQTGHWTQMAWANSTSVGCGLSNCQVKTDQCVYVVCNYFPPGNFKSESIYQKGKPCRRDLECTTYEPSKCDRKLGLCRRIIITEDDEKKAHKRINKKEDNKSITKQPSQVENKNIFQPIEASTGVTCATPSTTLDVSVSESASCTNRTSRSVTSKSLKSNKSAKTIRHDETKCAKDWKTKYPPILTNNMNDGKLLMEDGRPFWHRAHQNASGEYDEDAKSEKDLPMDENVLQNLYDKHMELAEMPKIIVHQSPYAPLDQLKKHTNELCTRDILMGNTVRAMFMLCDELSQRDTSDKKSANDIHRDRLSISQKRKAPVFVEPTHVTLYDRAQPTKPTRIVKLKELQLILNETPKSQNEN